MQNHEEIIQRALDLAREHEDVEAIFLMGSFATNSEDFFSDIDFYVMIKDVSDYKSVNNYFMENIEKLGIIIHSYQSNANPKNSIIYFQPYIKFEFVIEVIDKLRNKWRIGKRAKLIYDKNGFGKQVLEEASQIRFNLKRYEREIKNVAIELPSFCFNIVGYINRGEYVTSLDFIAWIRRLLLRISGFFLNLWDEGTRRAEQRFPKEIISYYHRCQVCDFKDIWLSLDAILEWYSDWLVPRFENHDIVHASAEVELIKSIISHFKSQEN